MTHSLLRSAAVGLAMVVCMSPASAHADGREPPRRAPTHRVPPRASPPRPAAPAAALAPQREAVRLSDGFFMTPLAGGVGFAYGAGPAPAPVARVRLSRR